MSGMEPVAATNPAGAYTPPVGETGGPTSRSVDPAKQPSEVSRPVAPAGAARELANKEALSGDISGVFMSIFGGNAEGLDFGKGVTLEQLRKAGSSVKKELFDLIANGMKTKDEGQGSDTLITADEIQEFFKNVDQFRQMAQLPEGDIGKIAKLYNEEGVKFTRVDASQIKQMSDAVKQKWGTLSAETDPYKRLLKTIGNKPDVTDEEAKGFAAIVDPLSNKIIDKDFKTASEEERMKMIDAYVFMQWAMQEKIDVEKLYGGNIPSVEGSAQTKAREDVTGGAGRGLGSDIGGLESMTLEQQNQIEEYRKLLTAGKTEEAKQYWSSVKGGFPPEIAGRISELQDLMSLAPKIKTVTEEMDRGDLAKASAEFEKIRPTLSESEIKQTERMLVMANFENKLMLEGVDSARSYFDTVRKDLPQDLVANIDKALKDPALPQKIQEAKVAREKENVVMEDRKKVSVVILGELGVALSERSSEKIKSATDVIRAVFDKNKDNGSFWNNLNAWSVSDRVPEQARNQISGRFADHSSGIAFLDECRAFVERQ